MPLMTSLTSVCAPKPIATPTTPALAISGADLDAERGQAHERRDDDDHHEKHVAQDRQQGAQARAPAVLLERQFARARQRRCTRVSITALMTFQRKSATRTTMMAVTSAAHDARDQRVAARDIADIDVPAHRRARRSRRR